jgi:hypothetical protein
MDMISAEIVEKTWRRVASLPTHRAPSLIQRMAEEQPLILAYLMAVDNDIFNNDERQLLLYLGVVVWQIMSQGTQPLPAVTEEILDQVEDRNIKMAEYLQRETTEDGFEQAAELIISNYGQPEVLKYVVEALMEEPEEGCVIQDENRGLMFLDLKTVIDCFDV